MSALTDEDLDAIEARANAAAPGPWVVPNLSDDRYQIPFVRAAGDRPFRVAQFGWSNSHESKQRDLRNAVFVAHAREDVPRLVAEVRRLDNEVENLRIAVTIGPRVAEVNAAVEREASVARFRSVIDDFLRAPAMFARDPECGAHVVYGAMLATGGNGQSWHTANLAVGLVRGNVAVAAETWDDVARLARHIHETAPRWVGTR